MRPTKNYLILKGEVPILRMLHFLGNLQERIAERASENHIYEPWQMFGHIAASGNAGLYGLALAFGSSVQKCREFETSIYAQKDALDPTDCTIVKSRAVRRLKDSMENLVVQDNNDSEESSDAAAGIGDIGTRGFALIPGIGNTGRSFLATYKHDLNPPPHKRLTKNEMLLEAFCVRSIPDRVVPLHDLYDGLCLQSENKHGEICICLKGPTSRDGGADSGTKEIEIDNERNVAADLRNTHKFLVLEYVFDNEKGTWKLTHESNTTLEAVVDVMSEQILSRPPLRKPTKAVLPPPPNFI